MTKTSGVGERRKGRRIFSSVSAGKRRWRFRFKPLSISISPRQGVPCLGISCCQEQDEEVKSDAALSGKAARNSFQAVAEVCLETFATLQQKRRR